jgi:hypothetical protein
MFSELWVAGTSWREHEITGWCMADFKKNVVKFLRSAYRAWNEPPKTYDYENEKVLSGRLFPDQVRGALINAQDSKIEFFVRDNRILLKNLTDPEAIDELCAMAIDVKYPLAREIATECNYEPRGLHRRVLFFYATQQWAKYDALDPDGELLRRDYTLATPDERKQIAAAGRAGGRSEIVELVAKAWQAGAKPVPKADAEIAIETLLEQKRYVELWAFAREAAPKQSARALRLLAKTDWQPEEAADRIMYANLSKLSLKCPPDFTPVSTLKETVYISNNWPDDFYTKMRLTPAGCFAIVAGQSFVDVMNVADGQIVAQKSAMEIDFPLNNPVISPDGGLLAYIREISDRETIHVEVVRLPGLEKITEFFVKDGTDRINASYTFVGTDKIALVRHYAKLNPKSSKGIKYFRKTEIVDIKSGKTLSQFDTETHNLSLLKIAASPNGQLLITSDKHGGIHFWSIKNNTLLYSTIGIHHYGYLDEWKLEFSENGALIFYTGYDSIDLREINNGQIVASFIAVDNPRPSCLHLSSNGKFLAVGYHDHEIRLWDVEGRKLVRAFKGFGVRIEDVKFTAEGLVAIARDGTIKVWRSRLQEICERPVAESSLHDLLWLQKRLKRCKTKDEYAWTRFAEALLQPKFRYEIEIGDWNVPTADRYDIDLE